MYLCGCVFSFLRVCIFVCLCFCVCVFAWLCFCVVVFSACVRVFVFFCVCVFVFVVKTSPFAREAAEGGNGGSNPPGPHFYMYLSHGGGEKCGPNLGSMGCPVRYQYTTTTCFASISRWGLAFFWALVSGLWPSGRSCKPLFLQIPRRLLQPGSWA